MMYQTSTQFLGEFGKDSTKSKVSLLAAVVREQLREEGYGRDVHFPFCFRQVEWDQAEILAQLAIKAKTVGRDTDATILSRLATSLINHREVLAQRPDTYVDWFTYEAYPQALAWAEPLVKDVLNSEGDLDCIHKLFETYSSVSHSQIVQSLEGIEYIIEEYDVDACYGPDTRSIGFDGDYFELDGSPIVKVGSISAESRDDFSSDIALNIALLFEVSLAKEAELGERRSPILILNLEGDHQAAILCSSH